MREINLSLPLKLKKTQNKMTKLFLLRPNFPDKKLSETDIYFCPDCAMIEGVLSYYPELKQKVEITYVDFEVPRQPIVDLVGEGFQGCPILIIHKDDMTAEDHSMAEFRTSGDYKFLYKNTTIARYLGKKHKVGLPH